MAYTMQQAFDKIRTHLSVAGSRCTASGGYTCLYYGNEGARCAVGALIPDSEYSKDLEGMELGKVVDSCASLAGLDVRFLRDAQSIHDDPDHWGARGFFGDDELDKIGIKYGLEVPE